MKKIIYLLIFTFITIIILINSFEIIESIRLSFSICINNLFPSLIPFMLLSNILIKYNFIDDLSDIFKNLMTKFFKVNKNCSFAFIMSILSGTPSNSKYLKDLLDNNLISIDDCCNCLKFCHFTNPIFILGTIGSTFLNNKKMGLIILFSHYISNFIIGFFNKKSKIILNKNIQKDNINNNFISILKDSIKNTLDTLFLILGIITTCLILTCLIGNLFNIPNNFKYLYGLIEITQGLNYLSITNLNIKIKTIISSFLISFGGFCIHMQVFSILDNKKIRYFPYLISRIIHAIISSIITAVIVMLY